MKSRPLDIFIKFLWLGCTSFGGPIAHIGIFRRQFVEKERRITESDYASMVALCQLIPGPASSQIGMGLGYRFAGWAGAVAAWLGFTLPSATLMFFAGLWILSGDGASEAAWFVTAMKLVAVGVVTQAVLGMWGQLCADRETKIVALISAVAFYSSPTTMMQVSLIGIALVGGYLLKSGADTEGSNTNNPTASKLRASFIGALLWAFGVLLAVSVDNGQPWTQVFSGHYFSGALVFGGGHVVLPLLEAEFIPPLESGTFLSGYGFAQAMPGPLFTIASYLGAVMLPETAVFGATLGVVAIFLPGAIILSTALCLGQALGDWKARLIYVNAAVVGLLFAVLINPLFTEAVYSETTTGLAILSLLICVALKRSPLELVAALTSATYVCHLLDWV